MPAASWRPLCLVAASALALSAPAVAQPLNFDPPLDVRWFGPMPGAPPDIWGIYALRWPGEERDLDLMEFRPASPWTIPVRMRALCAVAYVGPSARPNRFTDVRIYERISGNTGPATNFIPWGQRTAWFSPNVTMRHVDTSSFAASVWAIGPTLPTGPRVNAALIIVRVERDRQGGQ